MRAPALLMLMLLLLSFLRCAVAIVNVGVGDERKRRGGLFGRGLAAFLVDDDESMRPRRIDDELRAMVARIVEKAFSFRKRRRRKARVFFFFFCCCCLNKRHWPKKGRKKKVNFELQSLFAFSFSVFFFFFSRPPKKR